MSERQGQMPIVWQSLDVRRTVKAAMADALRSCPLSRAQVVDKVNELLASVGVEYKLTDSILEKWVAPSAAHFIPLAVLPAFCRAVDSPGPLAALAEPLGLTMAGPREQALQALGQAQVDAKRLAKQRRRALEDLEDLS